MLAEFGVDSAALATERSRLEAAGRSVVAVSEAGELLGLLGLSDAPRPEAARVVRELRERGLETWMITGDNARTAAAVAAQVDIPAERVMAEVLPSAKSATIEKLQGEGRRVAMVGDGLNDAPALAAAHASISPTTAAEATQSAADAVIQGDALGPVAEILHVARRADRLVRQNLALALLYNLAAVPLAIMGDVTPLIAAVAMSSSSLLVIGNALRLGVGGAKPRRP